MAITVTARGTASSTSAATVAPANFTPGNSSMLVAVGFMFDVGTNGDTLTFTDNFADTGGGAWTLITDNSQPNTFGDTGRIRAFYRKIGTTPGAHTVTAHGSVARPDEIAFAVAEVNGFATTGNVIGQSANTNNNLTTFTNTLSATPDAASVVFSCLFDDGGLAGPGTPTNYTSLFNAAVGGDSLSVAYDITSAASTAAYTGLDSSAPNQGVIFEIVAVPATAVPVFTITDNFGDTGGSTWTKAGGITGNGGEVDIYYRLVGTGAVSGTVTSTAANSSNGRELTVLEVKGRDTTTPLAPGQVATNSVATAAATVSLPNAPAVDSVVVEGLISLADPTAPGTPSGFTSSENASTGGDGYQAGWDENSPLQGATFAGLTTTRNLSVITEFRKPGVTGGGTAFRLFANTSLWNTVKSPTGPFSASADSTLANASYGMNGAAFCHPFYRAQPSDPVWTITRGAGWGRTAGTVTTHAPAGIQNASGSDAVMTILDIDGTLYDCYGVTSINAGAHTVACAFCVDVDGINGPGFQSNGGTAMPGTPQASGTILASDVAAGVIPHALFTAWDLSMLGPNAHVAPATAWDDGAGYGVLPEGGLCLATGTRPGGLNTMENALWDAASTYGVYVCDMLTGIPRFYSDGSTVANNAFTDLGLTTVGRRLRLVQNF